MMIVYYIMLIVDLNLEMLLVSNIKLLVQVMHLLVLMILRGRIIVIKLQHHQVVYVVLIQLLQVHVQLDHAIYG